MMTMIN